MQNQADSYLFQLIFQVCRLQIQKRWIYQNTSLDHTDHFLVPLNQIGSPMRLSLKHTYSGWQAICPIAVTCEPT